MNTELLREDELWAGGFGQETLLRFGELLRQRLLEERERNAKIEVELIAIGRDYADPPGEIRAINAERIEWMDKHLALTIELAKEHEKSDTLQVRLNDALYSAMRETR